ncbi:GNAT family N-acetyltransferase, partial [uncultured Methylobacterium sp.]|uniref:GNAT family N-acetyltransferase n=1 Tax=uncultured Methylobacterium sp. TaxID=157278 RepID=UPI0035CC4E34
RQRSQQSCLRSAAQTGSEETALFDAPVLLTEAHDGSAFDSGEPVLDDWLRQRAWHNLQNAASRSYVVCPTGANRIIGYAALNMGQILAQDVTGAMRRNMPRHIPAILLGRLAIDRAWQGHGLGRAMLADVIHRASWASMEVSARLVVVHAISPAAEAFYRHHGFTRLPVETPTLALDLIKMQKIGGLRE